MNDNKTPVLVLSDVGRWFGERQQRLIVLKNADLTVSSGELVGLVGPSGSGKSTLLHIAGLLDTPSSGDIFLAGQSMKGATDRMRTHMRRDYIGFVYQFHLLLPDFTALENVMMPLLIAGQSRNKARERAIILLERVGLKKRLKHRSGELSGGEQQRVAIARALANEPKLLLADEPTGNLDPVTAASVFETLMSLVRETGLAAVIATHNPDLAAQMDRRIQVIDGQIVEGA